MYSHACGSAARRHGRRAGFALRDLVVCIVCLSMLGMLGCMCLNSTSDVNYRGGCLSNIRQLSLGIFNHESTLKRFPLATSATAPLSDISPGTLGTDDTDSSGYSWLVKILPYVEEDILFDEIRRASSKFQTPAFHPDVAREDGTHLSTIPIPSFVCPYSRGNYFVDPGNGSEYDDLALIGAEPAITSYMAVVGTHASNGEVVENGVLVSGSADVGKGVRISDIADGTSQTILLSETREPVYAAWFDGQATWVVGLDSTGAGSNRDDGFPGADATVLNRSAYSTFALGDAWAGRIARDWGPSSEHDGLVMHAFADGHAQSIDESIDPTVYFRLITRNGGEKIPEEY